jgi:hypothetical protein
MIWIKLLSFWIYTKIKFTFIYEKLHLFDFFILKINKSIII